MRKTLCKLVGCDRTRFQIRTLCLFHIRERERTKREENKAKRLARKQASKKFQQSQLKTWRAKTWKVMSEWVRRSGADWRGYVACYTCGIQLHYKLCHASHFIHGKLDFDERNLKSCCVQCNLYLSGNLGHYAVRLIEENGIEWVHKLQADAAQHPGYQLDELKLIFSSLSERLNGMK